jgi:DNA-binding PucR family transcriptional regulator
LDQPQQVLTVRWSAGESSERVGAAVERALRRAEQPGLLTVRPDLVVGVLAGEADPTRLYGLIRSELGSEHGVVALGGVVADISGLPRSYEESLRALAIKDRSREPDGAVSYEDMGIARVFGGIAQRDEVDRFVRQWLGALLDYDQARRTELVSTLATYLDLGRSYDETARALMIHRSTLRYRLKRIRELASLDLNETETELNVHLATRLWRYFG